MVNLTTARPVAAGHSGLACPHCDYSFTHKQACGVIDLAYCPKCNNPNEVPSMTVRPTKAGLALLDDERARTASWYHITQRRNWLPAVIEGDVPVYVGTELAALTRAHDAQLREPNQHYWWLHELKLAKNVSFLPGVEADCENNWITSLADFEAFAGDDVEAVRYLNGYEDPGGISLLVDPNFLQVARVTLLHTAALTKHLRRALAEREREDAC